MIRKLKNLIKLILRNFGRLKPITSNQVIHKFSIKEYHTFFGYYDISPFSHDDSFLLSCMVEKKGSPLTNSLKLGYFNLNKKNTKFVEVAESSAWCWQMGARLRWICDNQNLVSYNSIKNEKYINVFQNPFTKEIIDTFEYPF